MQTKNFLESHGAVIGFVMFIILLVILFSSPEDIFWEVNIIDTNAYHRTSNEIYVQTTLDFYNKTDIQRFPKNISGLAGREYPSEEEEAMRTFKTDVVLLRRYHSEKENRNVQFVLIRGANETLFHDPQVCYKATGWDVGRREIEVVGMTKPNPWNATVNKLHIQKGGRKEVVMYWYMWTPGVVRDVKNSMMIRLSIPYYNEKDKSYALDTLKNFTSEVFHIMYKPQKRSDIMGKQIINRFGIPGLLMEILLIVISFVLIFYNKIKNIV